MQSWPCSAAALALALCCFSFQARGSQISRPHPQARNGSTNCFSSLLDGFSLDFLRLACVPLFPSTSDRCPVVGMLFFSFFKTLVGQQVVVELKNGISLQGELISVDQYLNVKLNKLTVAEEKKYPQLACLKNCFVRGSVIRYIHIPPEAVDVDLLQDAARKENSSK